MTTKLRYQLSAETCVKGNHWKYKIQLMLREYGYHVVNIKNDTIHFELEKKGWGSNISQLGKADGGTIKIIELENGSMIVLTYYINLIYNILLLTVFILFTFYFGWAVLFLVLGWVLLTFLQLLITKVRHQDLLKEIMEKDSF